MGEACSGKSTLAQSWSNNKSTIIIELGNIVRSLKKTEERIFDAGLDRQLNQAVSDIVINHPSTANFIVVGVRQVSLLKLLSNNFDEYEYFYLDVPKNILEERFDFRQSKKDNGLHFDQILKGDELLGIKELREFLLKETNCTFLQNY